MRKIIIIVALVALLLPLAEPGAVSAQVNPIRIMLNGRPLATDVAPIIHNGRTLVPFRAIFEAPGARVTWDETTNTVSGYRGRQAIILELGSNTAVGRDGIHTNAAGDT